MAVKTRQRGLDSRSTNPRKPTGSPQSPKTPTPLQAHLMHYLPVWLLAGLVVLVLLPGILSGLLHLVLQILGQAPWLPIVPIVVIKLPNILTSVRGIGARLMAILPGVMGRLMLRLLVYMRGLVRRLPLVLVLCAALVLVIPGTRLALVNTAWRAIGLVPGLSHIIYPGRIALLFTSEVDFWADSINRWAAEYNLDPNLLATIMQIESCGHPTVSSSAGAQGLFQVMPFHFLTGENQLDPDTNARHSAEVLNTCLEMANGDTGLAMACYNGGPRVLSTPYAEWDNQAQRYYTWGTGIYGDARGNSPTSDTLNRWLDAGGARLCQMAGQALGIE